MARLDELAEAISKVLGASHRPEPLSVDLRNHTPPEATVFIRGVIDACQRSATPLSQVRTCPLLGGGLLRQEGESYNGIGLLADQDLNGQVQFFRFPPSA